MRDALDDLGTDYERADSEPNEDDFSQTAYFHVPDNRADDISALMGRLSDARGFDAEVLCGPKSAARAVRPRGKILGLIPCDMRPPSLARLRERLWSPRDERFLVPTFFGVGRTVNLRAAPRRPMQAPVLAGFVLRRIRRGWGR
ncbi:MAG TPA: hypothetical protein VKA51_12890 [Rubrobacteraceae bacterium]|nr:hypothetical protein [Rubrobacteraceae bacterium]